MSLSKRSLNSPSCVIRSLLLLPRFTALLFPRHPAPLEKKFIIGNKQHFFNPFGFLPCGTLLCPRENQFLCMVSQEESGRGLQFHPRMRTEKPAGSNSSGPRKRRLWRFFSAILLLMVRGQVLPSTQRVWPGLSLPVSSRSSAPPSPAPTVV